MLGTLFKKIPSRVVVIGPAEAAGISTGHPVASAVNATSFPVSVPVGGITSHATLDETTFEIYLYGVE